MYDMSQGNGLGRASVVGFYRLGTLPISPVDGALGTDGRLRFEPAAGGVHAYNSVYRRCNSRSLVMGVCLGQFPHGVRELVREHGHPVEVDLPRADVNQEVRHAGGAADEYVFQLR